MKILIFFDLLLTGFGCHGIDRKCSRRKNLRACENERAAADSKKVSRDREVKSGREKEKAGLGWSKSSLTLKSYTDILKSEGDLYKLDLENLKSTTKAKKFELYLKKYPEIKKNV